MTESNVDGSVQPYTTMFRPTQLVMLHTSLQLETHNQNDHLKRVESNRTH